MSDIPANNETLVAEAAAQSDDKYTDFPVSWEVTGDTFVNTEGDIAQYISSYRLNVAGGNPIFNWKLEIHNVQNRSFRFVDRTADYYDIDTSQTGHHSVHYNSEKPQIKTVRIRD